jgi:transcriptional regulator with XRE-family HTH domain
VDERLRNLGALVRRERTAQEVGSQGDLATLAKISPRKVSDVERGLGAGPKTYDALERALGFPDGSFERYLAGGPLPEAVKVERSAAEVRHEWSAEDRQKILSMSDDEIIEFGRMMGRLEGKSVMRRWMIEALRLKDEAASVAEEEAEAR